MSREWCEMRSWRDGVTGWIPRDVLEDMGIDCSKLNLRWSAQRGTEPQGTIFFTADQGAAIHAHPEFERVGVQREAREVIAASLEVSPAGQSFLDDADWVLAALAEAGYEVGRWEQVGSINERGDLRWWSGLPIPVPGPVYRRVEGGATGEQT